MATNCLLVESVARSFNSEPHGNDLVSNFLIFFARFEYALKRSGYYRGDKKKAEANWDCFAVSLRSKFDSTHTQIFEDAVAYLSAQPPKKQVILNGKLDWSEVKQGDGEGSSDYILRLVRTVRNNLFHGGKFPNPTGPMADTARDRALLENCLVILNECALMDSALKIWLEPTE